MLTGRKDGGQIHADDAVPFVDRHLTEQSDIGDAGIIDQNIHAAKTLRVRANKSWT